MRKEKQFRNISLTTPVAGYLLFLAALATVPISIVQQFGVIPLCLCAMIVLHHAGHEAVHGSLWPARSKRLNAVSGWLAYAVLGQNFIFMRWSHQSHHRYGRADPEYTIDFNSAAKSRVHYYLCLLGASNLYHELAGYIYPLTEPRLNILTRRFKPSYYRNFKYLSGQCFVLAVNIALWWAAGLDWLFCKVLFTVYWGIFQNVSHYGLPTGTYHGSRHAARTYRLPMVIEFFLYRAGMYHLEHHYLPSTPGLRLNHESVQRHVQTKLGGPIEVRGGLFTYIGDALRQFAGPFPIVR